MCGIGIIHLRDPQRAGIRWDPAADALLKAIAHRGRDATGYVAITQDGRDVCQKAACDAGTFLKYRRSIPADTQTLLLHTRAATQGHEAFPENNHPVRRGDFYVVHNGHVMNDREVFKLAERDPFGDVDTEAIAALFAALDDLGAAGKALAELDGDAAIGVVDRRHPGRAIIARGIGSPLYVLETRRAIIAASTPDACESAHRAGIGSLGRARPKWCEEGTVLHINGSHVKRASVDLPYQFYGWRGWDTTSKGMPAAPIITSTPGGRNADPLAAQCELCGWTAATLIERFDGYDSWHVCRDCADEWQSLLRVPEWVNV